MKAVSKPRYGTPDVLRVVEVPDPVAAPGQVVVKVHAASLNTADLDHLAGRPWVARIGSGVRRPATGRVGLDVAGTVEHVADGVTGLRPGDRVWADLFAFGHGSLAEYVAAPAHAFAPMPSSAPFPDAAAVPHSGVLALQALRATGTIRPGHRVLVVGAGGCVGPFAVQLASAAGAEVTAVDHAATHDMLCDLGADHVVDFRRDDVTAGDRRYDHILDIAEGAPMRRYRRILTPTGGFARIGRTLSGFAVAAIVGAAVTMTSRRRMGVFGWRPNDRRDLDTLAGLVNRGQLRPRIDSRFALADAADAFRYLSSGRARGKVVVLPPTPPTRSVRQPRHQAAP